MVNKKLKSLKIAQEVMNLNNEEFNSNFIILLNSVNSIYYRLYFNLCKTLFNETFKNVLCDVELTKKLIDAIKDSKYIDKFKSNGNCICGEDLININEVMILDKTFYLGDVCVKNFNPDLIPKMKYYSRKLEYIKNLKNKKLNKINLNRFFTHISIYKIFGDFNYKLISLDDLEKLIDSYPPFEDSIEYYTSENIGYEFKNQNEDDIIKRYVEENELLWLSRDALHNHMIGLKDLYLKEKSVYELKEIIKIYYIPFNKLKFDKNYISDITDRLIKLYKREEVIIKKSELIKSKLESFYNYYVSNNYYNYYGWMFDNFQGKK